MKNVLLIDSGSGGVNVLKECVEVCPHCNYLLFCDDKNLPYGGKTKEELIDITFKNLENINKFFKFDIVVLACNTLTSTCIEECRKKFACVKFVGTEPAVLPALREFEEKDIVVLATHATISHNRLLKSTNCILKDMPLLATLIDENLDNLSAIKPILKEELKDVKAKAIVLGCTHYFAVREILQEIFPNAKIFDSANGVARRLKYLVKKTEIAVKVQIMISKDSDKLPALWWHYFNN